jgi:hypothetical protein
VLDPGKTFQHSLIFASKARTYPSAPPFWCSPSYGNGKLLAVTNALAYYKTSAVKSFITLAVGVRERLRQRRVRSVLRRLEEHRVPLEEGAGEEQGDCSNHPDRYWNSDNGTN